MRRIGYIASHYPAVAHAFLLREVRALRLQGVEVETFSIHRARPEELLTSDDAEEARRTHAALPASPVRIALAHALAITRAPGRYIATLRLAVRTANPGVRGRLWGTFYFAEAMIVWRAANKRHVRHLHAAFADVATDVAMLVCHYGGPSWSWSIGVHGPVEFYDVTLNRLADKLESARFATAVSEFARSQLMALGREERWPDYHVVRCGLDAAEFAAPANGADPQRRDDPSPGGDSAGGHAGQEAHILCVGRLVQLKGQSLLIEAFAELLRSGRAARLTLVGDGPRRPHLERMAGRLGVAERVTFTGALGQDRVRALYRSADVFCLPSMAEGLPVVLMEAMATGVPVLSTRIMGIPELVEHERTGLLVEPGRVQPLLAGLQRMLDDRALCDRLADAARRKVLSDYDINASAARLKEILEASLDGHR